MKITGICGCRSGWVATHLSGDKWTIRTYAHLAQLAQDFPHSIFWIDIPIGLPEVGLPRAAEQHARKLLSPKRHNSVNTVPVRAAVYADTYEAAKIEQLKAVGKSISKQSWNILPKVRETDTLLRTQPSLQNRFFEAHPELCYANLNGGQPMQFNKKSPAGQGERHEVLAAYMPSAPDLIKHYREKIPSRMAKIDDIMDATILCISAVLAEQFEYGFLPPNPPKDAYGLPMRMTFPQHQTTRLT